MGTSTFSAAASLLKGGGGGMLSVGFGGRFSGFSNSIVTLNHNATNAYGSFVGAARPVLFSYHKKKNNHNIVSSFPFSLPFPTTQKFQRSLCSLNQSSSVTEANRAEGAQEQPEAPAEKQQVSPIKEAADLLDIRVGRILRAWRHEEADTLYVEEVDVGEPEPRIICSGLVKYIPLENLQDLPVVVLANLKPRNMRGVKSCGMLMAASDPSHENVELLLPPESSIPGQRIWFGSPLDQENQPPPASPNQIQKKKIWELVQPHLKTDDACVAMLGEHVMRTSAGAVLSRSLKNANIS